MTEDATSRPEGPEAAPDPDGIPEEAPESRDRERDDAPETLGERLPAEIDREQLERVIRRAAELQFDAGERHGEPLAQEEVLRIGREVGLSSRHVRQALAEVRAESLLPEVPEDHGLARSLWGRGWLRAQRVVPGGRAEVQRRLEEHFRKNESLRRVRRRGDRSTWKPSESLVSKMQRSFDLAGRGYELAEAKQVELSVSGLEEGWSLVSLTVDLRNHRTEQAVAWTAGTIPVAAGLAVLFGFGGFPLEIVIPAAGGGVFAAGKWGGALTFARKREKVRLAVEGLLDRLEHGDPLEPGGPDWKERFLGSR